MTSTDPLQFAPSRDPRAPELTFADPRDAAAARFIDGMQKPPVAQPTITPTDVTQGPPPPDPRDAAAAQFVDEFKLANDTQTTRAFMRAVKTDPNLAGEAQKLGVELGLEPELVERNIDKVRELMRRRTLERLQLANGNSLLARMMTDPEFAAIASDQTAELGFFEQLYAQGRSGYLQSEQGLLYERVRQGVATPADRARAQEIEDELAKLPQDSSGHGLLGLFYGTSRVIGQMLDAMPEAGAYGGALATTAVVLGQAGPQAVLPEELVSVPTMFWAGFRAGLFGHTAKVEAGQAYKSMLDLGVSHEQAATAAGFVGLVNGTLEIVGFGAWTSTARKELGKMISKEVARDLLVKPTVTAAAKRFAVSWLKDAGGEVITEVGQEITSMIAEEVAIRKQMGVDPSKLDWEAIKQQPGWVERVGGIIAETLRGVALLSSIGPLSQLRGDMKRIREANGTERFVNGLSKGVDDTKLTERSPGMLERFLRVLGEGTRVENVYFKTDEFTQALEQAGISKSQLAELAPEVAKAYGESVETGVVEVPTHTWGARFLSSTFGKALAQDARVDPDGVSIREVRKIATEEEQQIVEQAKKILTEKEQTDKAFVAEVQAVRDDMERQLIAAGRTPTEAKTQAMLYGHFATVYSGYEKLSPQQWHETVGMRFLAAGEREPKVGRPLQQLSATERAAVKQTKIRDAAGKPMRLYHGTTAAFEKFRKSASGIWFAPSPEHAEPGSGDASTQTRAAYVSAQNPYTLSPQEVEEFRNAKSPKAYSKRKIAELQAKGHDAMIVGDYAVVAFQPEQVVNAIGHPIEDTKFDAVSETTRLDKAVELAESKQWGRVRDMKVALQQRTEAAAADAGVQLTEQKPGTTIPEVVESKEVEDYLVDVGTADALQALSANANAVGWYDLKTRQALAVLSLIHPELKTDPDARFAFVYVLAVTSNGIDVSDNFPIAARAYKAYRKTGKMPTDIGIGTSAKVIAKQLRKFNELAEAWGLERFRKMMLTPQRAGIVQSSTGLNVDGESADTLVLGAAILGPKIGNGFFANLYGMFDQLTMDRWLVRTWGRWTGTLIVERQDKIVESRTRVEAAIKALSPEQRQQLETLQVSWEEGKKDEKHTVTYRSTVKFDAAPDELAAEVVKMSARKRPRDAMIAIGAEADELRRAAISLRKYLDGQKEDPQSPAERQYIRRVFGRILERLQADNPDLIGLTMADLQAVLWYAEKRLYDTAKAKAAVEQDDTEAAMGYTDDEAPDYANAAVAVARTAGVDEAAIASTLKQEEQHGRPDAARRRAPAREGQEADQRGAAGFSPGQRKEFYGAVATLNARSARAAAAAEPWSVRSRSVADDRGRGVLNKKLGAPVVAELTLGQKLANRFKAVGIATPKFFELDPADPQSAKAYRNAIRAFKKSKGKAEGAAVYVYDSYQGMRLFLSESGKSGVAVKADGDIVSLFSDEKAGRTIVEIAVANGGIKADAFDTILPGLYAAHGLKVVARVPWNEAYKPPGWSKRFFKAFNGGEPDVVYMVVDPSYRGFYDKAVDGKKVADGDAAAALQQEELAAAAPAIADQSMQMAAAIEEAAVAEPGLAAPSGRGRFYERLRTAVLEKDADSSTVIHEMSHFFFTTMVRVASGPNPPIQVRNDVETILRWFAETGDLPIDTGGFDMIAQWNALTDDQRERFHEQLAYSFELYAFEGKAPAPQLESLYARMRTWMIRVYRDIRDTLNRIFKENFGTDLPAMTPEVKQVFDRMLASQQTIEEAEAMRRMLPLYQDKEAFVAAGFTEDQWDEYQQVLEEARAAAVTDLTRASLSQLRWLRGARGRVLKQLQKEGEKVKATVRERVTAEVKQEQVYMALELLREAPGESKLSLDDVRKLLANLDEKARTAAEKKLGTGRRGVLSKKGADIETTANFLGYESADLMVRDMVAARPIDEEVELRVEKEMLDQHGELTDPQRLEAAVEKALHNEARARFIAVEQRFLSGTGKPVRLMVAAARFAAQRILGGRTLRTLRPDRYAQAEARAAREAEQASRPKAGKEGRKAGDPNEAAQAKQRQLLNNQLASEALKAREQVAKAREFFKRLQRSNEKLAKAGYDVNVVNIARWLLARTGLLPDYLVDRTVDYLEMLQRYDPQLFDEHKPVLARFAQGPFDYRDLTLDEFRALHDAVRTLWERAQLDRHIEIGNQKMMVEDAVRKLVAGVADKIPEHVAGEVKALTKQERAGRMLLGTKANLTRVEHLFRYLDHGEHGAFSQLLFDELRLALDKYRAQAVVFTKRLVEMVRALPLDKRPVDATKEFGYTFTSDAELVGFLLHMGNRSNQEKALVAGRPGHPWADIDVNGEVDISRWLALRDRLVQEGRLKPEHFRFAQQVWDMMEEIKPLLQEAHRYLEGYYFKEVEAQEFTVEFPDGHSETFRGGYVPAAADRDLMGTAEEPITPDSMQDDFRKEIPKVQFGNVKERIDNYRKRFLTFDVNMIAQHIDKAMRFAFVQPRIRDVLKILGGSFETEDGARVEMSAVLNRIHPNVVKDVLMPWLDRAATQTLYKPGGDPLWNAIGKFLRRNTGVAIMMLNPVNAAQQLTGITNSLVYVKRGYLMAGLRRYTSERGKLVEWILKRSDFMKDRIDNQVFSMRNDLDEMLLDPSSWSKLQAWTAKKAYALQAMVQNQVDIVTWIGAFDQTMAERKPGETAEQHERRAILEANSTVRLAQGSFNPEDVAKYEVGSPWQRAWTQFTGFFNNVLNTIGYSDHKVRAAVLAFSLPMVFSEAIAKVLWGQWDSDDPDQDEWVLDGWIWDSIDIVALSQLRGAAAFLPAVGPQVAAILEQAFSNRQFGDKVAASPTIMSLYRGINGLINTIKATADGERDATGRNIRDTMTLINQLTGLPLAPLARPVSYLTDWSRGKIDPSLSTIPALDVLRGLTTGRASTGTKQ